MPGPGPQRRLPWEPLRAYAQTYLVVRGQPTASGDMAELLGTDRWRMMDWANKGLTLVAADRICTKVFGIHPQDVWGDSYWSIPATKH